MTESNPHQTRRESDWPVATDEPVVYGELPGMATVSALAAGLEISPTTAYRWVREKKLVAWECREILKGPVDQVLGPREPLPVLAEISAVLDLPPEMVWDFVRQPAMAMGRATGTAA